MNSASSPSFGHRPRRAGYWLSVALSAALLASAQLASAAPLIMDQPDPQPVFVGAQVAFSVTAESLSPGPLRFQWRRNGVDIPGALRFQQGPVATDDYLIFNVQPSDCGVYSVVVSDLDGAVNSEAVSLLVTNLGVLPVEDSFQTSGDLGISTGGAGRTTNVNASQEPEEPNHGGKRGGASVWVRWTAPFEGIATFRTLGSGIDTTLGVYTGKELRNLQSMNDDDDAAGFLNSIVSFNAVAGTEYRIAIDGYYGAMGDLILEWQLQPTTDKLPVIENHPVGRTVLPGTNATFTVVPAPGFPVTYQWFFNGNQITGATAPVLDILSVQPEHVGTYRVRLRAQFNQPRDTFSRGATLQINTAAEPGNAKAAAMRKFREAIDPTTGPDTPAFHPGGGGGTVRLASGFTGTQIFNTYGSGKEPGEPNHCNEAGGASYWFSYQSPATGVLNVDTSGTAFNSVLAIYTGPGDSFGTLVPLACSSTNTLDGTEAVSLVVTNGQTNYIVVDGVEGASGLVFINYNLASPPVITSHPQSQTVGFNSNVTLTVTASGAPALGYRWRSNSAFLPNRTNASLTLTNFKAHFEAGYDVVVTNSDGAATSSVALLYLDAPLRFTNTMFGLNNQFSTRLLGRANTNYVLQFSTNLSLTSWVSLSTNFTSTGILAYTNSITGFSNRFFRARSQ